MAALTTERHDCQRRDQARLWINVAKRWRSKGYLCQCLGAGSKGDRNAATQEAVQVFLQETPQFASDIAFGLADMLWGTHFRLMCHCHNLNFTELSKALEHKWKDQDRNMVFNVACMIEPLWRAK